MRQIFSAVLPAVAGTLSGKLYLAAQTVSAGAACTYRAELRVRATTATEGETSSPEELSLSLNFDSMVHVEAWLRSACAFIVTSAFCTPEIQGYGRPPLATTMMVALFLKSLLVQMNGFEKKAGEWRDARLEKLN